jgi:hypothetical protein
MKEDGKAGVHTLDARVDIGHLANGSVRDNFIAWLRRAGEALKLKPKRIAELRGTVLEIRQGYKSADSKRQNADLRFGMRASNEDYLPVICIVSTQASQTVCNRYTNAQLLVLLGNFEGDLKSTFDFFNKVIGYDLAKFLDRNSLVLREQFGKILQGLLSPS